MKERRLPNNQLVNQANVKNKKKYSSLLGQLDQVKAL